MHIVQTILKNQSNTPVFLFKATCFGLNIDHHQLKNTIVKRKYYNKQYTNFHYVATFQNTNLVHNYFNIQQYICYITLLNMLRSVM